jgi:uncharacterized membrane protein
MSDPVLLDVTLRPNPPMKPKALGVVLAVVATINFVFALSFVLQGAWPVTPFLGLDVALLAWAFRESRIAAQAFERITLTMSRLSITRRPARGEASELALNPYWVRVQYSEDETTTAPLLLTSHGKSLQIGAFLGASGRAEAAATLKSALREARSAG